MNQGEIVIYKNLDDSSFQLEVRVDAETVWLNRHQIALLFDRDVKTIGKHIANALSEELHGISVVANYATTAADGKTFSVVVKDKRQKIKVKSKKAQWHANSLLINANPKCLKGKYC